MYEDELALALALAREAGARAAEARSGPLDIRHKADRSLVTAVDQELDAFLVGRLRARFPNDAVVGEESFEAPDGRSGAPRTWFVDPIDGTTNYALGTGEFTVLVGLAEAGRSVVGVVVDPEGGVTYTAVAGGPALRHDGGRAPVEIRVSERADLRGARVARSILRRPSASERYLERRGVAAPARVGSFGLRVCRVAEGACDFTYATDFKGGVWDLCGPFAILQAAGGAATDLGGRPVRLTRDPDDRPMDLVISNGRLHAPLLEAFAERPRQRTR